MELETTLIEMEQLIEDERDAIRNIEVERLEQFAERKLGLMQALGEQGLGDRGDLADRFREVVVQLRHNGVLLAHARNCVRDVIQTVTAPAALYDPSGKSAGPPKTVGRLNVTG